MTHNYPRLSSLFLCTLVFLAGCGGGGKNRPDYRADLSGTYLVHQIGQNSTGVYTTQVEVVSNGDGTGTYTIVSHSQGDTGVDIPFDYSVSSLGELEVTHHMNTDYGILANENGSFVLIDTDTADTDGEIVLAIGMKTGCTVVPLLSGDYQLVQIEVNSSGGTPVLQTSRVDLTFGPNSGEGSFTIVGHSAGASGAQGFFTYVVNSDCSVVVNGIHHGVVSEDANQFVIVNTDPADNSVLLAMAIKKSSTQDNTLLTGSYRFVQYEEDLSQIDPVDDIIMADVFLAGDGTGDVTLLRHSAGLPDPVPTNPITYTVNADGTFFASGGDTSYGIVMVDGEAFIIVDTDPGGANPNLKFGVGVHE